ncbi:MAG TPA: hypothetical protein VHB21_16905 [Minicystis sp.]|nr:hypothetical protein [Minicystis sp.]
MAGEGARKIPIEEQRRDVTRGIQGAGDAFATRSVDIGPAERGGDDVVPASAVSRRAEVPRREFADETEQPQHEPLVTPEAASSFQSRWDAIQASFVDDPRSAVERADQLVDDVLRSIAEGFSQQKRDLHAALERDGEQGERATEDMRQALRRYRAFFHRALSVRS